jgi:ATP-binding cassette subfamily B (MDR/TAP) protein 1
MGEGYVIESGTHDELLAMNGTYSRLVQAQKLRDGNSEQYSAEGSEAGGGEPADMEKAAREEIPLGRRSTRQSLASEILEQRQKAEDAKKTRDKDDVFGFFYMSVRMAALIQDEWKKYILGVTFATREFYLPLLY